MKIINLVKDSDIDGYTVPDTDLFVCVKGLKKLFSFPLSCKNISLLVYKNKPKDPEAVKLLARRRPNHVFDQYNIDDSETSMDADDSQIAWVANNLHINLFEQPIYVVLYYVK